MSESNGYATAATVRELCKLRYVDVPTVGGKFRLRSVNALEFIAIQEKLGDGSHERKATMYECMLRTMMVNGDDSQMFDDDSDIELCNLDSPVGLTLIDAALTHAGMSDDEGQQAKNLPAASGGSSPSGSQKTSDASTLINS